MSGIEEWRAVPGYEGQYEASSLGRVRSLDRVALNGRQVKGRVLALFMTRSGYLAVNLHSQTSQRQSHVHRAVLAAFAGPAPEGHEALHGDGNPTNNAIANLAWGTSSENSRDQLRHGTHPSASKTHCPKGHPYDEKNTYAYPDGSGRVCRTCRRANLAAWKAANPERAREIHRRAQVRYEAKKKAEVA